MGKGLGGKMMMGNGVGVIMKEEKMILILMVLGVQRLMWSRGLYDNKNRA